MLQYEAVAVGSRIPSSWDGPSRAWPAEPVETAAVALIGYQRLHAESLQICIRQQPDLDFSGSIASDALGELENLRPSVIVLQRQSTVLSTVDLIRTIQQHLPCTPVVVSNVQANSLCNLRYLESGALGYVYQHESINQLLDVVRMAAGGEPRIEPDMARPLLSRLVELNQQVCDFHLVPTDPLPLSQREEEVAVEICKGKSNQQIADELYISTGTVKNHVHRILRKLNVKDRQQAGIIYRQLTEMAANEQMNDRPVQA